MSFRRLKCCLLAFCQVLINEYKRMNEYKMTARVKDDFLIVIEVRWIKKRSDRFPAVMRHRLIGWLRGTLVRTLVF